jgi:hypothetical protein
MMYDGSGTNDMFNCLNKGLKGETAEFAKKYLMQNLPEDIKLIESNEDTMNFYLPLCTKYVSAIGYRRRKLPKITLKSKEIVDPLKITHNYRNGQLLYESHLERLFGYGLAFPAI